MFDLIIVLSVVCYALVLAWAITGIRRASQGPSEKRAPVIASIKNLFRHNLRTQFSNGSLRHDGESSPCGNFRHGFEPVESFRSPSRDEGDASPPVSVMIAARNEAHQLDELLCCLQRQTLPVEHFQVNIIDDRSADNTTGVVHRFRDKLPLNYLRVETVPSRYSPKKFAIASGIEQAKFDVIILTDADCRPGPAWLNSMTAKFEHSVAAVIGYSPVTSTNQRLASVLNIDSLAVAAACIAACGWQNAYLATGRNLAYRKSAFQRVNGFDGIAALVSGDDDLLIQKFWRSRVGKIIFNFDPASQVASFGPSSLRTWLAQKRRHLSAGRHYPAKVQIGYLLYHAANLILWLAPLVLGLIGIVCWVAKLCGDYLLLKHTATRLRCRIDPAAFLIWQFCFLFIHCTLGPFAFVGRVRWK